jgi:hypothetical protein
MPAKCFPIEPTTPPRPSQRPLRTTPHESSRRPRSTAVPRLAVAPGLAIATCLAVSMLVGLDPSGAAAESRVLLESRGDLQPLGATTFDDHGRAIGASSFDVVTEEGGVQRIKVRMAVEGGGRNVSEAVLAPIVGAIGGHGGVEQIRATPARHTYRLLEQRSQATRADGVRLDLLVIDHRAGRISCYPADAGPAAGHHLAIPEDDRVVNVPMQLLFEPLVMGETDAVHFQIALCREEPVLHDMIAVRGPRARHAGREVVEVRYGPDLGATMSWLASRLLPKLSFWFDGRDGSYLGHRMPLHTRGPDVFLVRRGLTPPALGLLDLD